MKRILLVDDNMYAIAMLRRTISKMGYSSVSGSNGLEGLEVLNTERVGLVISDLNMPEMDGLEFIREIRKRDKLKNLPVFITTAYSQKLLKKEMDDLSVYRIFQKPFNLKEFMESVSEILSVPREEG